MRGLGWMAKAAAAGLVGTVAAWGQTIEIITPAAGATVTGNFDVVPSLTNLPAVYIVEYYFNGRLEGVATRAPWSYWYPARGYADDTYYIKAIAKDALGTILATNSTSYYFITANNSPAVMSATWDAGEPLSGVRKLTVSTIWQGYTFRDAPGGGTSGMPGVTCNIDGEKSSALGRIRSWTSGSAYVSTANDTITLPKHGLWTGQGVYFLIPDYINNSPNSNEGHIADGRTWTVYVVDSDTIKLAVNIDALNSSTFVDITTTGVGVAGTYTPRGGHFFSSDRNGVRIVKTTKLANGMHRLYCTLLLSGTDDLDANRASCSKTFATTDVNTGTDTLTQTNTVMLTGAPIFFTSTGTVPSGLGGCTSSAPCYVARIDANTYRVATSEANAVSCASSGTNCIDVTSQGSGTHTAEFYLRHTGMWERPRPVELSRDFQTSNSGGSLELMAAYRQLYLIVGGATVSLAPYLLNKDGTTTSLTATDVGYESENTAIATVSSSGVVAGVAAGNTRLWIYHGEYRKELYVWVDTSSRFTHFGADGSLLSAYDPSKSIYVNHHLFARIDGFVDGFNEVGGNPGTTNPAKEQEIRRSGINVVSGIYPTSVMDSCYYTASCGSSSFQNRWNTWKTLIQNKVGPNSTTGIRSVAGTGDALFGNIGFAHPIYHTYDASQGGYWKRQAIRDMQTWGEPLA